MKRVKYFAVFILIFQLILTEVIGKPDEVYTHNRSKISPKLHETFQLVNEEQFNPNDNVNLTILLKDQTQIKNSLELKREYHRQIEPLKDAIRSKITEKKQLVFFEYKTNNKNYSNERELVGDLVFSEEERLLISNYSKEIEKLGHAYRQKVYDNLSKTLIQRENYIVGLIENNSGIITKRHYPFNAIDVSIPLNKVEVLIKDSNIATIYMPDFNYSLRLNISAEAINADALWDDTSSPANGPSPYTEVAILDTGVDTSHDSLEYRHDGSTSRTWYEYSFIPGDASTDDPYGHGTHVAGIVASSSVINGSPDDEFRGIIYDTRKMINSRILENTSDQSEWMDGINWSINGAGDPAEVISNSYGDVDDSDGESTLTRFFDFMVDAYDIVSVNAVDNTGPNEYTLNIPEDAYNVISVGNINDQDTTTRTDDEIWITSGRGQTDDRRKKPDVVAPGTDIYSTNEDYEGANPDYVPLTGTSMATPHVSAAAAWFMDYGLEPLEVKALLINTALDCEENENYDCVGGDDGWDEAYGWGYIDLEHAHFHIDDIFTGDIEEDEVIFYLMDSDNPDSDDTATLVWNRHINEYDDDESGYDLNDLDLVVYKHSDGDYLDSSESSDENVEQVVTGTTSDVVYKISTYGSFSGVSSEDYAFATEEGASLVDPPDLVATLSNPATVNSNQEFTVTADIDNDGDIHAHDVVAVLTVPYGFSVSGNATKTTTRISAGSDWGPTWTVTAPNSTGNYTLSVDVTSTSYEETFDGGDSSTIEVVESPQCSGITPPASGDWNITSNTSCSNTNITLSVNSDLNVIGNVTLSFDNVVLTLDNGSITAYDEGDSNGIIDSIVDTIIDWIT